MSMKNCSDTLGNRTRDLSICRAVPQQTAPPAACSMEYIKLMKSRVMLSQKSLALYNISSQWCLFYIHFYIVSPEDGPFCRQKYVGSEFYV
jgi:hypothetical protein